MNNTVSIRRILYMKKKTEINMASFIMGRDIIRRQENNNTKK